MPCSGPQGGVPEPRLVFQTTLFPSARGTSRVPVRLPSVLPPIASHRSGTTPSNPRFHGAYCPATLSPKDRCVELHCEQKPKKDAAPKQTQHPHTSPLKHHKKGETIPFTPDQQTSIQRHPCTNPAHNRRRTTSNPSARDTSEEYRPPIHKTLLPSSVPIPTQNTPPVCVPPLYRGTEKVRQYTTSPPSPHFFLP